MIYTSQTDIVMESGIHVDITVTINKNLRKISLTLYYSEPYQCDASYCQMHMESLENLSVIL